MDNIKDKTHKVAVNNLGNKQSMTNTNTTQIDELRDIHNNKQNLVYIELQIMSELQKVSAFGYSMANTVGLEDFMKLNNEAKATDYQQAAYNIMQLFAHQLEQSTRELQTKVKAQEMFTHKAIELAKIEAYQKGRDDALLGTLTQNIKTEYHSIN